MSKTAALEYVPNIRINALCPGYVDADMLADSMSRRGEQILACRAKVPLDIGVLGPRQANQGSPGREALPLHPRHS